jgi:alkanesulfonate monooxygenase SsuD/methylene tetrahydromethanopterin reductase-like flavin-dependent oxidoreductase (luciferase family)
MTTAGGGSGPNLPAVDGWFLPGDDADGMRAAAAAAESAGAGAVIVREGPAGDPLVLVGALATTVSEALLGVCVGLDQEAAGERRHPTVLARDMTTLDLLSNGRSLLCFAPPFGPAHLEAVALCRAMWRLGLAESAGPIYPVPGAINRPQPAGGSSPRLALDLTTGETDVPPDLIGAVDYLLRPGGPGRPGSACRMERP